MTTFSNVRVSGEGRTSNRAARVVALIPEVALRSNVARALAGHPLSHCSSVPDVALELKRTGARMFVAQFAPALNHSLLALLEHIQRAAPRMMVAFIVEQAHLACRESFDALGSPAAELLPRSSEMNVRLSLLLEASSSYFVRKHLGQRVGNAISGRPGVAAKFVIRNGNTPLRCSDVAARLGVSESTVLRSLECAGMSTEKLIAHGRAIAAAVELDGSLTTIERTANELGFASGSALCNQMKSVADGAPAEVRRRGGADWLTGQFIRRLRDGVPGRALS